MTDVSSRLTISLGGIAKLARVERPVVSMWRSRFATSATPFPESLSGAGQAQMFDVEAVATWLTETNHGNNPDALADAAAFARPTSFDYSDNDTFASLTAMIALRFAHGTRLSGLDWETLADLAETLDPDDDCLEHEIERLGEDAVTIAEFVDVLVDAAYDAEAAMETAISSRTLEQRDASAASALSDTAIKLMARIALELATTTPSPTHINSATIVDVSGVAGDLIVGVKTEAAEAVDVTALTANSDHDAARLVRRRLLVHGIPRGGIEVQADGEFAVSGPVVHIAQFPSPSPTTQSPLDILSSIESIVLQMDDGQRGVIIAPASVLVDARLSGDAAALRSALIRSGRIRAIVRLPAGLVPSTPRRATALWVLGPAHESVPIADRWTMTADLSATPLTPSTIGDLVGDLAAAIADFAAVSAHSFRFARLTRTSTLLARSGSLINSTGVVQHAPVTGTPVTAKDLIRVEELFEQLGGRTTLSGLSIDSAVETHHLPSTTLGALVNARHIRLLSGTRLRDEDIESRPGFTVIGIEEISGAKLPGSRTVDRLALSDRYPSARLTEPGDVVFCSSPRPRAWVDREGSSVVVYPARILRISRTDSAGLIPDLLAGDISATEGGRDWREWTARRVLADQRVTLVSALDGIREARTAVEARLAALNELADLLTAGVAAGTLAIDDTDTAPDPTQLKGRH